MHCFLLFSVGTLPLLSIALTEKVVVVQNITIKMCFYELHISSNAQPSILMHNHKKNDKEFLVMQLLMLCKHAPVVFVC